MLPHLVPHGVSHQQTYLSLLRKTLQRKIYSFLSVHAGRLLMHSKPGTGPIFKEFWQIITLFHIAWQIQ